MVYDESVAQRIQDMFGVNKKIEQRKMFGGVAFLVEGKMCCGVLNQDLVLRMSPEQAQKALENKHARPMDFTGRPMKGFVYVAPEGYASAKDLEKWLDMSYKFADSLPQKRRKKARK